MFGMFKANLLIEKAIQLTIDEFGIDPLGPYGGRASDAAQEWRGVIREVIKEMTPTEHELAVGMAAPYAPLFRSQPQAEAFEAKVRYWLSAGLIRQLVADHFLDQLHNGTFEPQ